ncbi:HPr family phosphocarrier protein [bacterium]|nr:HPr family phosphocarrier protein [bacterium]
MLERQIKIINRLGLHLRAATKLVQLASEYEADISIFCDGQTADAKSIMDVLMLAAIIGKILKIRVSGKSDEEEENIMNLLTALIDNRFGESE